MHPTMLVATAAVLPIEDNDSIHFGGPEVNHNEIKPGVVNEVAQSVVRQGPRSKEHQVFGTDMEVLIAKTKMVSTGQLKELVELMSRHEVTSGAPRLLECNQNKLREYNIGIVARFDSIKGSSMVA